MLGAYVCRQCRARLSRRIAPVRNPQWQPRATFLSFRDKTKEGATVAQTEPQPQQQQEDVHKDESKYGTQKSAQLQPRHNAGRYSGLVDGDSEAGRHAASSRPSNVAQAGDEAGPAHTIEQALKRREVDRAWHLFEQNYTSRDCKALTDPSPGDVALLHNGKLFDNLLRNVNRAFCSSQSNPVVTPTALLLKYEQLGVARPEFWARNTLAYLTHHAILAVNAPPERSVHNLPAILTELLSVWRLFFQCKGTNNRSLESAITEWNLPAIEALPAMFEDRDFGMRLQKFHPGYVGNAALGFCAVYFYVLSDALGAIDSLHTDAKPFVRLLERLLASSFVGPVYIHTEQSNLFKALPEEVKQDISKEINNAPKRALAALASRGETLGQEAKGDEAANMEAFQLKRIARAVESRESAGRLNSLWTEMIATFTTDGKTAIPRRIYNAFLSGYMVLLHAERSVQVWNHMIAHGIKPDIQSWVALLDGCVKAKDLDGFNTMWARMLNTGIEPDNYAWTTRISGLFSLRQINLGLAALDEMGKRWASAEQGTQDHQAHTNNRKGAKKSLASVKAVNRCTKPSIEVINAAITALLKLNTTAMRHEKRIEYASKVLGWAANFSIKPDVITYNSLMQLYLRAGDYSTAFKILGQMEKEGIEGDAATHSMLVTASFDNHSFDGLTESQQADKIITLFNSIEAGGVKLNDYVYGTAIDRLLKQYSNNTAVRRLMDHMLTRNVQPSAQIYTMLVTYYFQQNPPAIQAVDALVEQFFTSHRMPTDRYLFDRTIEGYAHHGEIGKMMSVLTRMSKLGTHPGFFALTAVLEALVRDGDHDRARNIVREVESGVGVAKGGITGGRTAEEKFFALVRNYGLEKETIDVRVNQNGEPRSSQDPQTLLEDATASLDPETMGDFTINDEALRASRDQVVTGDQATEQDVQQAAQSEQDVHGFLADEPDDSLPKATPPHHRK